MQVRGRAGEGDGEEVPARRDAADVQRLGHVAEEVRDELDGVGAGRVLAVADLACLGLADAALEDLRLVGEGRDDASL